MKVFLRCRKIEEPPPIFEEPPPIFEEVAHLPLSSSGRSSNHSSGPKIEDGGILRSSRSKIEDSRWEGFLVLRTRRSKIGESSIFGAGRSKMRELFEEGRVLRRTAPSSNNSPIFEEPLLPSSKNPIFEESPIFVLRPRRSENLSYLRSSKPEDSVEDRHGPRGGRWYTGQQPGTG